MSKRNLFITATALLAVLMVGILPVFVSSGWVRDQLVSRINSRIPGTLSSADCSIGWKQGFECSRVVYDDTKRGVHANIPKISGSQGLLALIVAPRNLGTVSLDRPILVLPDLSFFGQDSTVAVQKPVSSVAAQSSSVDKSAPPSEYIPFWDKVIVQLLVEKGVVKISDGSPLGKKIACNVSLDAGLASGSVHFKLESAAGSGSGKVAARGFINLPARQGGFLETLVTEINLKITALQLAEYHSLLPTSMDSLQGQGELSSELLFKATGTSSVQVIGTNRLRNVQLTGGFLGEDHPALKLVTLDLDITRNRDSGWQVPGLHFFSDLGTLELTGSYGGVPSNIRGKGRLELPQLLQQLPHLLRARPGTKLEHGGVDFAVDLEQNKQNLVGAGEITLDNVSGLAQGSPFFWDEPIRFTLAGSMADWTDLQLSRMVFNSPFANIEGAGGVTDFSLYATADLDRATQQLGTVFQPDWQAGGKLLLIADSHQSGENEYTLQTNLSISDMTLSRQGKVVLPEHLLTADSSLQGSLLLPADSNQSLNFSLDVDSWPGSLHGAFTSIYRRKGSFATSYQLNSDLQLDKVTDLLHNADLLAGQTTVGGRLHLQSAGYFEGGALVVREVDAAIDSLVFKDKETVFSDPAVRLVSRNLAENNDVAGAVRALELAGSKQSFFNDGGGYSLIHPAGRRIVVRDAAFSTSWGSLDINRLTFADWQQDEDGKRSFSLDLHANSLVLEGVDLQQLTMPVSLEQDILNVGLSGKLSNGTFKFSPRVDFTMKPPLVLLPEAEQVLTNVGLDKALDAGLLQWIHPVLGRLMHPVGTINARMDSFSWPLADTGAERADFSVILDMSQVTFTAEGRLQEVLLAAGVADTTLRLQENEITCIGAAGRVSCTPLQFVAGEKQIVLSGSAGMDGSLDYLLELPITEQLAGSKAYPLLQGKTLKIPIRGSHGQVDLNADVLAQAVADLLVQVDAQDIEAQVNELLPGLLQKFQGQ